MHGAFKAGAHSATDTAAVLAATAACGRPRWAKLSPNTARLTEIAAAAADAGADAVTLVNTVLGMAIDPETRSFRLGSGPRGGGLSGPLGNLDGTTVSQAPPGQVLSDCRTGADANRREDCRIVGDVNSVQSYWQGTFASEGRRYVLAKTVFFGLEIAAIGCYNGLQVEGGAASVGRATTRTVVLASICVLISDFFLTKLFLAL